MVTNKKTIKKVPAAGGVAATSSAVAAAVAAARHRDTRALTYEFNDSMNSYTN